MKTNGKERGEDKRENEIGYERYEKEGERHR